MTNEEVDEYLKNMQENIDKMDSFIDQVVNELADLERKEQAIKDALGDENNADFDMNSLPPEVKQMVSEAQENAMREGERRSRDFMADMNYSNKTSTPKSSTANRVAMSRRGMML